MNVSEPIAVAAQQLQDVAGITWAPEVLLQYLNLGVREIIDRKPEAFVIEEDISLIPGTRQAIPSERKYLIDVFCSVSKDGVTGRTVRKIGGQVLDSALPDWRNFPAQDEPQHLIYDSRTPLTYELFPPMPEGTDRRLRVVLSAYPFKIEDQVNGTFPLTDDYEVAIIDYMIYRALAEETTIPNALAKSQQFYNKFRGDLGEELTARKQAEQPGQ